MRASRLHLLDGTFELFRQHFSRRPPHRHPDGRLFTSVAGFAGNLLGMLRSKEEAVTHIAVAFDNPIESFRNDLFPAYKSSEGVPQELLDQFDPAEEATRALGVTVWSMKEWECDDALATGAVKYQDAFEQVRILSPDKDLSQCVVGKKVVTVDRMREIVYDEAAVIAKRGVPPASIPDLLALIGDEADGYPGLPGFGDKSAAAVLAKFGHIETIPDDPKLWPATLRGAEKLAATLRERRAEALLYKKLATLVTDVPLKETVDDLRWRGVAAGFPAWCDAVGLPALKRRA